MNKSKKEVCRVCNYWEGPFISLNGGGRCRRFPPMIKGELYNLFPNTRDDDYCGEFRPIEVI